MKRIASTTVLAAVLTAIIVVPAMAEVVYTQTNISIPVGSNYNLDIAHDGVTNFTFTSKFLQAYCQGGDQYIWSLTVTPASGNAVVSGGGQMSSYAAALQAGVTVNSTEAFYSSTAMMAELYWGCRIGMLGEWLNLPDRYLGVQFQGSDHAIHYGWVKLSTVAYVDENGHLQTSTIVSGFAYETIPGQAIAAGQTSG